MHVIFKARPSLSTRHRLNKIGDSVMNTYLLLLSSHRTRTESNHKLAVRNFRSRGIDSHFKESNIALVLYCFASFAASLYYPLTISAASCYLLIVVSSELRVGQQFLLGSNNSTTFTEAIQLSAHKHAVINLPQLWPSMLFAFQ
jgi:hypothetical protein